MLSKNFSRQEFECGCGCGFATVDIELLKVLEKIRSHFGSPVTITSGCRCAEYNDKVGGSYGSKHKQGIACDIRVRNVIPSTVYDFIDNFAPMKYGIGLYSSWVHIDVRNKKARWKG